MDRGKDTRGTAFLILGEFEEVLVYHGIRIPSGEMGKQDSDTVVHGADRARLADAIVKMVREHSVPVGCR